MFKKYCGFFPLFLGAIYTIYLSLAIVPGRLESYIERDYSIFILSIAGRYLLYGGLSLWAGAEFLKTIRRDRPKIKISGIIRLSLVILTNIILAYNLPARLYFHTSVNEFDRVLVQQNVQSGKAERIGNFEILEIGVIKQDTYFTTTYYAGIDTNNRYGFAYIPNLSHRQLYTEHINGGWYIFKCISNPDRVDYCPDY